MYCVRYLERICRCYTCQKPVPAGLAGFYYNHALCAVCLKACEPRLAALLTPGEDSQESALQVTPTGSRKSCASCSRPIRSSIVGRRREELFCKSCFRELEPKLAAVLILEEAIRALVADRAPLSQYLAVARHYVDACKRLEM